VAIAIPDTAFSSESSVATDYGFAVDQTDDGETRLRDLYGTQQYTVRLVWARRSQAQHDALINFLLAYRASQLTFTLYGKNYTVRIIGDPSVTWPDPINAKISATFRGTAT
jgi:hypothetical protein